MVGPPRGPPRPTMAPQPRASPAPPPPPPPQPQQQIILKQVVTPYTMLTKPAQQNYVNYVQLPVVSGNGSFLAVSSKPPETNGTTFLTMSPRPGYLVTTANNNNNNTNNNNNSTTYIAMESPQSHQYLIPKPEPFAMHNYSKNEPSATSASAPGKRKTPIVTRPTNHQRIKEEEEDEGEEVRPVLDPDRPLLDQLVQIDHNYPHWLPPRPPPLDDDDKESTISSDEKPEHGDEGEETETAAEGEDSVTRCICNLEHDDGYMISCDQCYVWQHVACVLPDTRMANSLPDMTYLCDLCQPRELDRNRARALQLQRRKQILQRDDSSEDSWSSADRSAPPPKKAVARRRAEPIPRRPSKCKSEASDMPLRSRPRVDSLDGPIKNRKSEIEIPNRSKLMKPSSRGRRDSVKATPPPQPTLPPPPSVGRRTKLKRKFECKANLRRNNKSKEVVEAKVEKEKDEERKPIELRGSRAASDRTPNKSRCKVSHTASGEPILIATCRVADGEPLTELRGKYLQSLNASSRADVLFHYRFPKDGTEVIMDGTGRENLVRYARRTCYPNTQLKHCLVKGSLRLYLVAMEAIERNQQVTIPHGSVTDNSSSGIRETCGKDCTYGQKLSPDHPITERRRRSRRRTVSEESEGSPVKMRDSGRPPSPLSPTQSDKDRKMTREEKKIEQAMKIFAQMERDTAKKKDKERPSGGLSGSFRRGGGDSDKESPVEGKPRRRRRRRRRRSCRKSRHPSGSGAAMSHPSGDESDVSSADGDGDADADADDLPSPRGKHYSKDSSKEEEEEKDTTMNDAAGLLLALGGARHNSANSGRHTPPNARDNSENDSSPGTPLSSACLLVAAAVGPLAPGFKFPKTKKGMMNEWLNKSPEHVPDDFSPSPELGPSGTPSELPLPPGAPKLTNLSNQLYYPNREPFTASVGFGKKRWLRQAISEESEAPLGSPPCPPDNVTPLKKRRLARESLTSEPPTTPTHGQTPSYPGDEPSFGDDDSPVGDLAERVRSIQRDYMAAQGIEYDTSPQRAPENLSLDRETRESTPPTEEDTKDSRPRRGRKRPTAKAEARPSPRAKRKLRKADREEDPEPTIDPPNLVAFKEESVERLVDSSCEPPELSAEGVKVEKVDAVDSGSVKIESVESVASLVGCNDATIVKVEKDVCTLERIDEVKPLELPEPVSTAEVKEEVPLVNVKVEAVDVVTPLEDETACRAPEAPVAPAEPTKLPERTQLQDPRRQVIEASNEDDGEKLTPAKRKLSITEYLKRKKVSTGNKTTSGLVRIPEGKQRPPSPPSDDEISPLLLPTPTLPFPLLDGPAKGGRLKVEPTELERQRENLNERLRREFGLLINDDEPKTDPVPETNGFPESKLAFPVIQHLPQSAIYPVGSSNPPNPFTPHFPPHDRRNFRN